MAKAPKVSPEEAVKIAKGAIAPPSIEGFFDKMRDKRPKRETVPPVSIEEFISRRMKGKEPAPPQSVSRAAMLNRTLYMKEAFRKYGDEYAQVREAIRQEQTPDMIAKAMAARELQPVEQRAEHYAAIDAFQEANFMQSGMVKPPSTGALFDVVEPLVFALDVSQRWIRAAGWRTVAPSWKTAWEISKNGWADDLMVAGAPWWLALPVGGGLEAATDPLMVLGAGAGLKLAAGPGSELQEGLLKSIGRQTGQGAEELMRAGVRMKGSPAQLGLYYRNLKGTRSIWGVPGTQKIGTVIADMLGKGTLAKHFTAGKEPVEGVLRAIYKGLGEDDAAKAAFAMKKTWRPYGKELQALKLEPEALQRAWVGAEYYKHVQDGKAWAEEAFDQILFSDNEKRAAEILSNGFSEVKRTVDGLQLGVPDSMKIFDKRQKAVMAEIRKRAGKAKESHVLGRKTMRHATAEERMVGKLVARGEKQLGKVQKGLVSRAAELQSVAAHEVGDQGLKRLRVTLGGRSHRMVVPTRAEKAGRVFMVDVDALNKRWSQQPSFFIEPGSKKAAGFEDWLKKNPMGEIDMPELSFTPEGLPSFVDGRHRFAYMRDRGLKEIPVVVRSGDLSKMPGEIVRPMRAAAEGAAPVMVKAKPAAELAEAFAKPDLKFGKVAPAQMKLYKQYQQMRDLGVKMQDMPPNVVQAYREVSEVSAAAQRVGVAGQVPLRDMPAKPIIPEEHVITRQQVASPLKTEAELIKTQQTAEKLRTAATQLKQMTPAEIDKLARETMSLKDYGKVEKAMGHYYGIQRAIKGTQKRAEMLKKTAEGYMKKGDAIQASKDMDRLLRKAGQIDAAKEAEPQWLGRVTAKGRKEAVPLAERELLVRPQVMGKTGVMKARQWVTKEGRSKYLWEVEKEMRAHIADPTSAIMQAQKRLDVATEAADAMKLFKEPGKLSTKGRFTTEGKAWLKAKADVGYAQRHAKKMEEYLRGMFPKGEKWADLRKEAVEYLAKKERPMLISKFFETDPTFAVPMNIGRVQREALNQSMLEGLRDFAADTFSKTHSKSATELGGRIAELYPGKYFPQEIADDLVAWQKRSLAAMQDAGTIGGAYDNALGIWKFQAVFAPAFYFRNAYDDLFRALSEGPINFGQMGKYGHHAVHMTDEVLDLGQLKITGGQLFDLADAYGIRQGYWDEILSEEKMLGKIRKKISIKSLGEDARRIGYFAERLKRGFSPIQAARATKKVFFDYGDLAPWEKSVAKRIFPWWTFRRKNIAFQVEKLISQPYWSAAQLRLLRSRTNLMGDNKDAPDWVPDRLKGYMPLVVREPGVTSIVNGIGFSGQDLTSILDVTGHPKGAFAGATEMFVEEMSPIITAIGKGIKEQELPAIAEWMATSDQKELVRAPRHSNRLPESVRSFLGIEKVAVPGGPGGKYRREQFMMPRYARDRMRALRAFSEVMKIFRVQDTPSMPDNMLRSATVFLTGISKMQITETEVEEMLLRERMESYSQLLKEKGMVFKSGGREKLTIGGRKDPVGREFQRTRRKYYIALRKRIKEDMKRKTGEDYEPGIEE